MGWGLIGIAENSSFAKQLKLDPSRPLYQQIIEAVQRAVARGELAPGDQIPSQRELAQQLRVNPNTVQRAYREMEHMGIVTTARGTGTFITTAASQLQGIRQQLAMAAVRHFVDELRDLGYDDAQILRLVSSSLAKEGE